MTLQRAGALLLAAGLWAAAPPASAAGVRSLLELRQHNVVVQQHDLSCGAAALATILTYQHGDPVPEQEVVKGLIRRAEYLANPEIIRRREGFSLLDMKRYVEGRGYWGIGYGRLTLEDLTALAPLIVPVNFRGYHHFVIFRGVWRGRVLLADPAWGNRTMPLERFEAAWLDSPEFGRVGFVVKRRDSSEPPNQLAPRPSDFPM